MAFNEELLNGFYYEARCEICYRDLYDGSIFTSVFKKRFADLEKAKKHCRYAEKLINQKEGECLDRLVLWCDKRYDIDAAEAVLDIQLVAVDIKEVSVDYGS